MLNDDTMLFQIVHNIEDLTGIAYTYWTMISLNEKIQQVPEKLAEKLNSDGETVGETCVEKYVELATKGGINQLTVLQRNRRYHRIEDRDEPVRLEPG